MSRKRLRIKSTQTDNLIANLRGEVGEILSTWVMMRNLIVEANKLRSNDPGKDLENLRLSFLNCLVDKLGDEIVARLAELAEKKIGRLNFHFAATKLDRFAPETEAFARFIGTHRFKEKRNLDISHKELPERWTDHKFLHIPYRTTLRGIALSLRLMKTIDRFVLGPASWHLWMEMRNRRYDSLSLSKAGYMVLPYLRLSREQRARIIVAEMNEGREVWSETTTLIDGVETNVKVCKSWGAVLLGDQVMILDHYPLQQLSSLTTTPSNDGEHQPESSPQSTVV
jgi:hypothetical protein